ncbi:hypothetical protein EXIGLDRAFT_733267 [Exidia glandulosa HHB12029]|uniref:Uncharacterized protein n=1 Tax=Exidia glandulosa HHB12029 TaxID=1314781 RepID=A0A165Z8H3_EXIGL|nr:hypothetical protein EXIGLDRAFT_716928 [Exidia glandulosa HHB12029]KZV80309.1 hypothetical protein EXIGLDRAFT_733267 [Exidia glandulosa HHB12029]
MKAKTEGSVPGARTANHDEAATRTRIKSVKMKCRQDDANRREGKSLQSRKPLLSLP